VFPRHRFGAILACRKQIVPPWEERCPVLLLVTAAVTKDDALGSIRSEALNEYNSENAEMWHGRRLRLRTQSEAQSSHVTC
jgi:hypothetical protein